MTETSNRWYRRYLVKFFDGVVTTRETDRRARDAEAESIEPANVWGKVDAADEEITLDGASPLPKPPREIRDRIELHERWLRDFGSGAAGGRRIDTDQEEDEELELSGYDLRNINLSMARLGTNCAGSDFRGARFVETDLSGAILTSCDLRGAVLDKARLTYTHLMGARCEGMSKAGARDFAAFWNEADRQAIQQAEEDYKVRQGIGL